MALPQQRFLPSASNALSDRWTPSAGPCLLERNRLWKLWQPAGWHVCFYLNELIRVNIFVTSNQLFNHFSSVICFNQKWNTLGHRFCWNPVLATSFPEQIFWSKAFFFLGSRGEGAYDVPLLDRIEANEMANRPKVILRIISVLVVVSIYPSTWGGGRWVGVGRSEFKAMLSKYKGSLSQNTREEARKNTGMLSLSCLPGPASVISHFLVCLRGFYFIDYFKR